MTSPVTWRAAALAVLCAALVSCGPRHDTPGSRAAWDAAQTRLDENRPGYSVTVLREFLGVWGRYEIARKAERAIEKYEGGIDKTLDRAIEAARDGRFDVADTIIDDLLEHFGESAAGHRARASRRLDLPLVRARALFTEGKYDEAEELVLQVRAVNDNEYRAKEIDHLLENLNVAMRSHAQGDVHRAHAAARVIQKEMLFRRAREGRFPRAFNDGDLRTLADDAGRRPGEALTIESYRVDDKEYRIVARSKGADGFRYEITPARIRQVSHQ
ncbi:MAG: hypothetical protein M5R36_17280 [Deltaproteobacteria bacterium]|nr:hypothetical protein [Deltaproteobacteria bacterium]